MTEIDHNLEQRPRSERFHTANSDHVSQLRLHMIAVLRMRWHAPTRTYVARRTEEGLSKREIMRCLKRYIARETFHAIRQDLSTTTP